MRAPSRDPHGVRARRESILRSVLEPPDFSWVWTDDRERAGCARAALAVEESKTPVARALETAGLATARGRYNPSVPEICRFLGIVIRME